MNTIKLAALTAAVLTFSTTAAFAAEPPSFDWTGPYAGVSLGGVFNGETKFDRTTGALPNNTNALTQGLRPTNYTVDDSGFTAGAQIGYNQLLGGNVIIGVEADLSYTDLDKTDTLSNTTMIGPLGAPSAVPVTRINQYSGGLDYLGTVRGRLGYAFDRFMVYGTGGLAFGRVDRQIIFYGPNAPTEPYFMGSENGTKTGYTYGAGLEYAAATDTMFNPFHSSAVTFRVEYLHYDLGDDTLNFPGVNGGATIGGYTARVRTEGDVVRAGVNYRF